MMRDRNMPRLREHMGTMTQQMDEMLQVMERMHGRLGQPAPEAPSPKPDSKR